MYVRTFTAAFIVLDGGRDDNECLNDNGMNTSAAEFRDEKIKTVTVGFESNWPLLHYFHHIQKCTRQQW